MIKLLQKISIVKRYFMGILAPMLVADVKMFDGRMVYSATLSDLDKLRVIFKRLSKNHTTDFDYDIKAHMELVVHHIQSQGSCLFYTENAVIGGYLDTVGYNRAAMIATIWLASSNGKDGDIMLKAYEDWARESRATHVSMEVRDLEREDPKTEKVRSRFFTQKGFYPAKRLWLKRLV